MTPATLPALNALLNTTAGILLVLGYVAIKRGRKESHRRFMLGAVGVSAAFLASYVIHHALHGSTRFPGDGPLRTVYLLILVTHVVLAAAIVPMVGRTLWLATAERFDAHRRLARITWPTWAYVSVTGVVIYLMLYQL